jgi:tripartite-type tricarboxylate transporter receptor subunit TctC
LGEALGFSSRTIDNYSGTNAISLGLLGGEIDVMSVSLGSALRSTKAGDLEIAFVLSESLAPAAPDLPYLLGPGGQLEPHLAGMNDADRAEALRIGELVADLGFVLRTVIVPTALPADRMACLESAVNVVLFSDEFRDAAEAEGREVNALAPEAAQAALAQQAEALALASAPGKAAP